MVRRGLSDEVRKTRRQRISVNIYISFLSWLLEFIIGFLLITRYLYTTYIAGEDFEYDFRWYRLLHSFILFIVLPCTYIINTEKTKEIIVLQNWYKGIRSILLPSVQVGPAGELDPPAQPRDASASARNVVSNDELPERISEENQEEVDSPDTQTPPGISAESSDTQPSVISSNHLNSNDTFRDQLPKTEAIPLSNVRVIHVKSARK